MYLILHAWCMWCIHSCIWWMHGHMCVHVFVAQCAVCYPGWSSMCMYFPVHTHTFMNVCGCICPRDICTYRRMYQHESCKYVWQCIFSAPFCIFQYNQVASWWMLAVQLHCWSIAVASQTHSCHITVAQRPFMVVSEEQATLWWHNWHLLKVWSNFFDLMFQQNLTVVHHGV